MEVDFNFVCFGRYDRWLEVCGLQWMYIVHTAAVVHQGRPVPIGDSHKVARAATTPPNSKASISFLSPQ